MFTATRIQKGKNCGSVCVMAVVLAIKLMARMGGGPDGPQSRRTYTLVHYSSPRLPDSLTLARPRAIRYAGSESTSST